LIRKKTVVKRNIEVERYYPLLVVDNSDFSPTG